MESDPELLAGERLPRWQKVAVAVLALLVVSGWYADRRIGDAESGKIGVCDRGLRSISHEYDVRMGSVLEYIQPAFSVLSKRQISRLMAQPARQLLPGARASLDRCREGRVLPWHSTNVARRSADLAYGTALTQRVRTVARGSVPFQVEDHRLARLRTAAGIAPGSGS